jgi:serine/threonine protein kinase
VTQADIWSIGVIFFQMIYGKVPFNSRDRIDMIKEIDSNDILNSDKFVYNGVKASRTIQNFLRLILVIDQRKRIGWKELVKHPIFIDRADNKLPRSQIPDIGLPNMSDIDMEIDPNSPEDSPSKFIKNLTTATSTGEMVKKISKNLAGAKRGEIKKTEED